MNKLTEKLVEITKLAKIASENGKEILQEIEFRQKKENMDIKRLVEAIEELAFMVENLANVSEAYKIE